jgi:uncharacterized protein with HEPN domain
MNVSPEQAGFLWDILSHARDIQSHLTGVPKEKYLEDRKTQQAIERCFEIMGEAAGQLRPETIAQVPTLPVRPMREMRNFLIHVYFSIDLERVWDTCQKDIPVVISAIEPHEAFLRQLSNRSPKA